MELSFIQIGLILIVTMIAAVDQFNFLESLYRPIVIGPIVGAIMGDLQTGLIVGGSYELMMIGAMPVGGAQPPNAVIGGIMATVFAVQSGLDVAAALPSCNTICITWSICSYSFIYSNVSINGIM